MRSSAKDNAGATVDALGRIVVAAPWDPKGTGGSIELLVMRFESDGSVESEAKRGKTGSGGLLDYPISIAPDAVGGAFLTGATDNSQGDYDMAVWYRPQ